MQMILKLKITFGFRCTRLLENVLPHVPKYVTKNWENLYVREINVSLLGVNYHQECPQDQQINEKYCIKIA